MEQTAFLAWEEAYHKDLEQAASHKDLEEEASQGKEMEAFHRGLEEAYHRDLEVVEHQLPSTLCNPLDTGVVDDSKLP